jgi:hypothetical protein
LLLLFLPVVLVAVISLSFSISISSTAVFSAFQFPVCAHVFCVYPFTPSHLRSAFDNKNLGVRQLLCDEAVRKMMSKG